MEGVGREVIGPSSPWHHALAPAKVWHEPGMRWKLHIALEIISCHEESWRLDWNGDWLVSPPSSQP